MRTGLPQTEWSMIQTALLLHNLLDQEGGATNALTKIVEIVYETESLPPLQK